MALKPAKKLSQSSAAKRRHSLFCAGAVFLFISVSAQAAPSGLESQTVAAWEGYIRSTCARDEVPASSAHFLRITAAPERRLRVRAGETLV